MSWSKPYLDKETLALLEAAAKGAAEHGVEWVVTGAAGRVFLGGGGFGL